MNVMLHFMVKLFKVYSALKETYNIYKGGNVQCNIN